MEMPTPTPTATAAAPERTQDDSNHDEEEEMPLLFMDGLPSDFQRNAQLAALVTFMGSDDDDETKENEHDEYDSNGAYGRNHSSRQRRAARRSQLPCTQPYATREDKNKALDDAKQTNQTKKPLQTTAKDATKELQLYLSMFTVSSSNN